MITATCIKPLSLDTTDSRSSLNKKMPENNVIYRHKSAKG